MTKGIQLHLDELRAICEEQLAAKSSHAWKEPGNKFEHGIRTAKLAERLRTAICPDDDTVNADILTVAAWFHDLCNGQDDHENAAADALPALIGHLVTEEELSAVCALIRVHDHLTLHLLRRHSHLRLPCGGIDIHLSAAFVLEFHLYAVGGTGFRHSFRYRCHINSSVLSSL